MTAALSPPLREDGTRGVNARILLNLDEQTRSTLTPQSVLRQAGAGPLARSVPELGLTAGRSVQGERCY
jgi:hypothetical protein